MDPTASDCSRNRDEGSRIVQTPDLPLRVGSIINNESATSTSITVGKTMILAVDCAEMAQTVDSVGLEYNLNIGHVGFGEVEDVCS